MHTELDFTKSYYHCELQLTVGVGARDDAAIESFEMNVVIRDKTNIHYRSWYNIGRWYPHFIESMC